MSRVVVFAFAVVLTAAMHTRAAAQSRQVPNAVAHATLEELLNITITTASRTAEGAASAPSRVRVVTGADIQRRGYRSLADLLSDLPEFKLDRGGDPDYPAEFTVQGTRGASRIVLLMNGIRISPPTNEPLPILANYPVHVARQVEVLYGPASALYGADAFSAVINIITRDAADQPGLSLGTSVGQHGMVNQTGSYAARFGRNSSLMMAGQVFVDRQPDLTRFYADDFKGLQAQKAGVFQTIFGPMTPNAPVPPDYSSPVRAHSFVASLKTGGFQFLLFESRSRASTSGPYTPDNAVYSDAAFTGNRLFVGAASFTRETGRLESTSTLTLSRHEMDPNSGYQNVFSNMVKSFKYAYGSMIKLEQQFTWRPQAGLALTTGANVERYFAIPQGADLNAPITSRDRPGTILGTNILEPFSKIRYANVGAYAQVQRELGPAVSVMAGARTDYNTRYGWTFNPRAGVTARLTPKVSLKAVYGTAFLAPSPYQAYAHYGSFYSTDGGASYQGDYWHVANPELRPQKKRMVELELRYALAGSLSIVGSAFHARFWDLIKSSDAAQAGPGMYLGWPVAYIDFAVNEGRAATYGGTLGLEVLRSWSGTRRLAAHAGVALADGWTSDDDPRRLPIGGYAPVEVRAGLELDWGGWTLAPRMTAVGRQRVLATIENGSSTQRATLPGYATASINIRRANVFKGATAFLAVENIFDARYRHINVHAFTNPEEFVGAPQNPRRLMFGFELELGKR